MTSNRKPQPWEIWHARFNFSEGKGYKYRPVIIIDVLDDDTIVIMVTSSTNKLHLPHDYSIRSWQKAGLDNPSIARVDRIAQIPASYFGTAGYLGNLATEDIQAISQILNEIIND